MPSPVLELLKEMVTMASGLVLRTISKSTVPPFSVVIKPEVGEIVNPGDCESCSHPKSNSIMTRLASIMARGRRRVKWPIKISMGVLIAMVSTVCGVFVWLCKTLTPLKIN